MRAARVIFTAALLVLLGALGTASPAAGQHGPTPRPPPGVTITVNGTAMIGEEGGKIAGCSVDVVIDGLDAPVPVDIELKAVSPTTPEGSPETLVTDSDLATASTWSGSYPLTSALEPFTPHANGYRVRVDVTIDGVLAGSSTYWVGCDEPQTGNPTRILFAVEWLGHDGVLVTEAPDARLPDGWRAAFVLTGTSKKGEAICTFAEGSGVLECTYDNPGHGDEPGLVVPGNPTATYDVAVAGVPDRWDPDPADLGTFVGRDVCPRGHGSNAEDEHSFVCTHTVRLIEQAPPPEETTTTTTTTTAPPAVPEAVPPTTEPAPTTVAPGVEVLPETVAAQTLPPTGPAHLWLIPVGLTLVGLGALALRQSRRAVPAPGR